MSIYKLNVYELLGYAGVTAAGAEEEKKSGESNDEGTTSMLGYTSRFPKDNVEI